jgi:hypothetical protein
MTRGPGRERERVLLENSECMLAGGAKMLDMRGLDTSRLRSDASDAPIAWSPRPIRARSHFGRQLLGARPDAGPCSTPSIGGGVDALFRRRASTISTALVDPNRSTRYRPARSRWPCRRAAPSSQEYRSSGARRCDQGTRRRPRFRTRPRCSTPRADELHRTGATSTRRRGQAPTLEVMAVRGDARALEVKARRGEVSE